MAIKSSGSLSFADIRNEFGGPTPAPRGLLPRGSLVPNGPTENNIPTSGTIRFSDFYGAAADVTIIK